jgi:hypothetical protein
MESQLVIKVILIVAFAAFAIFLMLPGRGARHVAIRRLVMVLVLALTVLAVVFPNTLNAVAHAVGIGRGADLLLYGLIVVFIGNTLLQQRRSHHLERQITLLARRQAIVEARLPGAQADADADAPAEASAAIAAPAAAEPAAARAVSEAVSPQPGTAD